MKNIICILLAAFSMQISAQIKQDWRAQWISKERCQSLPNTWMVFRKTVNVENVPQKLIANIAVDSKYWLWINGKMVVFEGGLKRGPSPADSYYDEVEIAPYLQNGDNTIAILMWHFGKNGFSHKNSGSAALLFEAVSPEITILSDKSWDAAIYDAYGNTEAPYPNFRLSESNIRFDANKELENWYTPSFDGKLEKADVAYANINAPMGKLHKRPIPLFKDFGLKSYVSQRRSANGDTIFCKLPYNAQITPYFKVKAKSGATIQMIMDNYRGGSETNLRAEYITKDGEQEYESLGWMNGHEMYYIIPKGVEIIDLQYRETGYDTDFAGSFSCDDPFYNELWKRSVRTLYITMRDNYMDCPDRERAQWWGDEVNELGEAFYALSPSSHKLALKGIYELINWQGDDNILFSPVPAGNWTKELPLQMLASIGWYGFYTQYFYSGDSSFVAPVYDGIHRYLHNVWQMDKSGLPIERVGAWSWGDWGENVDMGVLTTCWYYLALKAEREFALQIGKTQDAERDLSMMQTIEKCFDTKYWTGNSYRSPGYKGITDDRAQAMAVVSGLAGKDKYSHLIKLLVDTYNASPYMEKYVLEALFVMNKPEEALLRMKNRYKVMLDHKEYTTLFEGWGIGNTGFGGGTINHAWSGGPLTMLSQKVCGITPLTPGFKKFTVVPQMGNLKEASATIETNYGTIEVKLIRNKKTINIELTVPSGTEAVLPVSSNGKTITLSAGTYKEIIRL